MRAFTDTDRKLWDIAAEFSVSGFVILDVAPSTIAKELPEIREHLEKTSVEDPYLLEFYDDHDSYGYIYVIYDGNRISEAKARSACRNHYRPA